MPALNPKNIRIMSNEEWEQFRQTSWNKKKEYYAREVPTWYLNSKPQYIEFMEKLNARKAQFAAKKANISQPGELTKKVDELIDDTQVDAFPEERNR